MLTNNLRSSLVQITDHFTEMLMLFEGIDYDELAKQKDSLISVIEFFESEKHGAKYAADMQGVLHFIDAFQDLAADQMKLWEFPTERISISPQMISDQVVTAFEGGSNYWIGGAIYSGSVAGLEKPWYSDKGFFEADDYQIQISTNDDDPVTRLLNEASVALGNAKMQDKAPKHWDDLINENGDATTADVWLQYVLFGEIVYG